MAGSISFEALWALVRPARVFARSSVLALALAAAFLVGAFAARPASAQPAPSPTIVEATRVQATRELDQASENIRQVVATFARPDLSEADFTRLRDLVGEASTQASATLERIRPFYDAAKSRVDQLGPKPDDKTGVAESAEAAATRAEVTRVFNDADAMMKRARLALLEADQAGAAIAERRRRTFARALMARTQSIASPGLWAEALSDLPRVASSLTTMASDWASAVASRAQSWEVIALFGYILAALLAAIPLRRAARGALDRRRGADAEPDDLQKHAFAAWSMIVIASMPIMAIAGALALADMFGLTTPRFSPILSAVGDAIERIAITAGLLWGMLAPNQPRWRLFDLSEPVVDRIVGLGMRIAVALSIMKILEATFDATAAPLATTVAARGVTALAVAAMLARGLSAIARLRVSLDDDRYAAVRAAGWLAALVIGAAALLGYVAAAAFFVEQLAWVAGVAATLYLLVGIVSHGSAKLFSSHGRVAQALSATIGLKPQSLPQVAVATSGAIIVLLVFGAAALIAAPWGIASQDVVSYLRGALGGVKIGEVELSLSSIIGAGAVFLLFWAATRGLQRWLSAKLLPATQLDQGLRDAIRASFGYVGMALAATAALSHLGFGVERLALVASALSVGIGFGLQSIVSNFVSGLIVLWERAIRVGDWISVGGEEGYVRRINVRSTEIETFDRVLVVMPNSNLVAGVVKNWVRGDKGGRVKVRVSTRRDADPDLCRETIVGVAKAHEAVLGIPAPTALFLSFDASALTFELICFIADVETSGRVKSDLTLALFKALREADLLAPTSALDALVLAGGGGPRGEA